MTSLGKALARMTKDLELMLQITNPASCAPSLEMQSGLTTQDLNGVALGSFNWTKLVNSRICVPVPKGPAQKWSVIYAGKIS